MKGVPLSAIWDGASRLLDIGGTRALRGRDDPDDAVLRDLRDAWADVSGELCAVVAEESAAHKPPAEGLHVGRIRVQHPKADEASHFAWKDQM